MEQPRALDHSSPDDEARTMPRCTYVDWCLRSEELDVVKTSAELGIQPSRAWTKGQKYPSKAFDPKARKTIDAWRFHPWGVWGVNTKGAVDSDQVEPHVLFLLDLLEPKQHLISNYLENPGVYMVRVSIRWESPVGYGGFDVSSQVLARIAALCHTIHFSLRFDSVADEE